MKSSSKPLISVIIPVKNGADTLKMCLEGIKSQTLFCSLEVIVLDSGSQDNTLSLFKEYHFVKVHSISPAQFNHGDTRNYGISLASGEFVAFTVQDAYTADELWLEKMVSHFSDSEVIGVCGQQVVPHDKDKNPHEWFRPHSKPEPVYVKLTRDQIKNGYSLNELHKLCRWDNVNSMYRRCSLLMLPFRRVSFGEDMIWAKEAVLAGNKIVYDPTSQVYHYHHATYDYTYKRTLTVLYFIYKNFGYIRPIKYKGADYLKMIYRNFKYKSDFKWIPFNWTKMNAANNAYKDLLFNLKKGEEALDKFHERICGLPPQGKQNI